MKCKKCDQELTFLMTNKYDCGVYTCTNPNCSFTACVPKGFHAIYSIYNSCTYCAYKHLCDVNEDF